MHTEFSPERNVDVVQFLQSILGQLWSDDRDLDVRSVADVLNWRLAGRFCAGFFGRFGADFFGRLGAGS